MSESVINLYFNTQLRPEKNFSIDSFEDFLTTHSVSFNKTTITKFQYIRPTLNLSIKIDKSQAYAAGINTAYHLDYLSITQDSSIYYYFVLNKFQKSESTIELQLLMDVLNTYKWETHYKADDKTLVTREHKDRIAAIDTTHFKRLVNLSSEGINAPLYTNNSSSNYIIDKIDISWSLFYKNTTDIDPSDFNQVNPVECYLIPSDIIAVNYNTSTGVILRTDIPSSKYWIFFYEYNSPSISFDIDGTIETPSVSSYMGYGGNRVAIALYNDGTNLKIYRGFFGWGSGSPLSGNWSLIATNPTTLKVLNPPESINTYERTSLPTASQISSNNYYNPIWATTSFTFGTFTQSNVLGENSIDRTNAKNIKIIKLPYCPTSFEYSSDIATFGDEWEFESGDKTLKLVNENVMFRNDFNTDFNPLSDLLLEINPLNPPSAIDVRNDKWESKIYHSDFYRNKFVYDSFVLDFDYEKIDIDSFVTSYNSLSGKFPISFIVSRNIVSKFMFMFPQYITKYGTQDYDNVVVVSRNNEEVLYTSQYINYLRTGYNYDLKSKQRNIATGGVGLSASIIGSLVGVIGGLVSGNVGPAILAGVAGTLSIATQSVSYAKSIADMEQNMERKLAELQNQSVSVNNADDIDLLVAYSNNRAKFMKYEVSPTMKQALLDMFYYCGYATQEQKKPNVSTRYWFNFLQCDLVMGTSFNTNTNISTEIIDEIKKKFKEGVTFFHKHSTEWNLTQTKENYEVWLLS